MIIEQVARYHSILSRFRTEMTKTKTFYKLFFSINNQLEKNKIIVKTGLIIDSSAIGSALRPKGKANYKVTEDRCEEKVEVKKEYTDSEDKDGAWLKKRCLSFWI